MPDSSVSQSVSRWIAVTWEHVDSGGRTAMIVEAPDQTRAAEIAAEWFTAHDDYADALPIEHLFVAAWEPQAYVIGCKAWLAELQCCGGGEHAEHIGLGGHYATCPDKPAREETD